MQITDLSKEQNIPPLFRLGFRPFFLAGAIFSIVSLFIWLLILKGNLIFSPLGGGFWWHIHEMLFGFSCAIIAGFLLTAVQTWTGLPGIKNKPLMALFALWVLGRTVLLFPNLLGPSISALIDILFIPAVAFVLAKPIIKIKQYRNLFFIPLLALFTLVNIELHLAVIYPALVIPNYAGYAGILLTTLLMSVMAGRVVPMFTANGTKTKKVEPISWLEKLTNGSIAIATFIMLCQPFLSINTYFLSSVMLIAGLSQAVRWFRWRPWITLKTPLLWSLHFSILLIWLGLMLLALSYFNSSFPASNAWHLITVGGIGGLVLAMISRVSLGHTGRVLMPAQSMSFAFAAIILAALIRTFGSWFMPHLTLLFIDISAGLWFFAFVIFTYEYAPMLLKPRSDGRPG